MMEAPSSLLTFGWGGATVAPLHGVRGDVSPVSFRVLKNALVLN